MLKERLDASACCEVRERDARHLLQRADEGVEGHADNGVDGATWSTKALATTRRCAQLLEKDLQPGLAQSLELQKPRRAREAHKVTRAQPEGRNATRTVVRVGPGGLGAGSLVEPACPVEEGQL